MLFTLIVFLSAISISAIAAGYSIIGLAALFSGATVAIIAMGSALEVGKLVAASWLYQNWRNPNLPKTIKAYLTTAVIVLVFITSMGIFGFLSKAHLDQMRPEGNNAVQITLIDKQIDQQNVIIVRAEKTLDLLDAGLEVYINKEYVTRGLRERKKQEEERNFLNNEIRVAMDKIAELTLSKGTLEIEQLKLEADVGPLKYVAELIYGDEAKDHFDEAVRWIIIVLIFVFDPLAVLLLIAANISFRDRKLLKQEKVAKLDTTKAREKRIRSLETTRRNLKRKEKIYSNFFKKLGGGSVTNENYEEFFKSLSKEFVKAGLDPDEVRLKLDQIMEWKEPKISKEASAYEKSKYKDNM